MSWWTGKSLTWFQEFACNVVKCGPVPYHVAVIMDGNRRYARKKNIEIEFGHKEGFEKLKELTFWCKEIGVREVTVYGWSIENFKRTVKEVKDLMDLTSTQFSSILEGLMDFMKDDMCIRVIGNLDLLSEDLRKLFKEVSFWTKNNKTLTLNLAFSYTGRDEITNAIKLVTDGVKSGTLETSDIDEELLTNCMYTNLSPDPEVLIRTSGATRFSDFLLWQAQNTQVFYVENVMWPEFSFWNLLKIIFLYQTTYKENQANIIKCETKKPSAKAERFLKKLNYMRLRALEQSVNNNK